MTCVVEQVGRLAPSQLEAVLAALGSESCSKLGLHLHNTFGLGLVNVYTALRYGVRRFESSVAGLGGCPYAPGAAGNVATEDVVHMLHECGFQTGIDLEALLNVGDWVATELQIKPESALSRARHKKLQ